MTFGRVPIIQRSQFFPCNAEGLIQKLPIAWGGPNLNHEPTASETLGVAMARCVWPISDQKPKSGGFACCDLGTAK